MDVAEGILRHSSDGTHLEVDSERLFLAFSRASAIREAWRRRVVGKLADGLFVSMEGCVHSGTTHYTMRRNTRMKFRVNGDVFLSSDEQLVSPDEILADEVHVEIGGLPEWFATALSHPYPSIPYTTGIPLSRSTQVEARCDERSLEVDLDDGFQLRVHNTLYWGSDGLFGLTVRQATVARIRASGLVKADVLLRKIRPLVDLLRFVSGENCLVRSAYLFRTDRSLPEEFGGGPVGVRLLTGEAGHKFAGWGDLLFKCRDIVGHEDALIPKWYRLSAKKRYALRVLDRVVSQGESAEAGIVLMVGAMQQLTSHSDKKRCEDRKRYEKFLRGLGLESWGIDVAAMGKKISNLRNAPAHGREFPTVENILAIYWFVVAAMRVYFLREMGFSETQAKRIARRQREVREGLGLPEESLDVQAQNEMLKPGWIMKGRANTRETDRDVPGGSGLTVR